MDKQSRIFVAGHTGFAGSALVRLLRAEGYHNLLLEPRARLDLRDRAAIARYFESAAPEYVFLVAGRVGGLQLHAQCPADVMLDNLAIATAVIPAADRASVRKLIYFASAACYPEHAPQPIPESALLAGPPDPALTPYAIAKIAGVTLCQAFARQYGFRAIPVMIPSFYGPGDHFDPSRSHAMASLIRRFSEAKQSDAKEVIVWGSGRQRREFLHVDDLARGVLFLMLHYDSSDPINVGAGGDVSIAELAELIRNATGYPGEIRFDPSKPEGAARRLLDSSKINSLGWRPRVPLEQGIRESLASLP